MKEWKGFSKGINLGGWLSQCDYSREHMESFITEPDFAVVAGWGMDHVRVPIDYNVLEEEGGGFSEAGFGRVAFAVEMARKYGLNILLDLHKTAGFMFDKYQNETGFFDDPALQERFFRLWEELAGRFGKDPEHVAFELLNEVTERSYMPAWNRIAKECIQRIRRLAPDTVLLVGSYGNNSVKAVPALENPYDDKVIYNFHCYDPIHFTHQHAYWVDDPAFEKDLSFEESGTSGKYFEELFEKALDCARERNTMLYCGEYGVIDRVEAAEAIKWYRSINEVFEKHQIGRAAWTYKKMDFGIVDPHWDGLREELLKVL